MSASTRTIQQPALGGSILNAVAMAAVVLTAALAIAWGSANLAGTTSVAAPVPAPVILDKGSRGEFTTTTPVGGIQGAPGAYRPAAGATNPGVDRLKDDKHFGSNQGAPAPRHAGPRAQ
jgi:hypothetical protein